MRQLTVAEVLRLALPANTSVAAGAGGLGRSVTWARVAGTRPLAAGSLEEGELVIFAAVPPALAGEGAQRLVALFVEAGCAGLLLTQAAPPALVQAADSAELPVLVTAPGARAADLERAVVALIVDSRAQLHQRADETYQRLTRIALEDRGLGSLLQALADTMQKLVIIEDEYGSVQETATPAADPRESQLPALDTLLPELRARSRELPWPGREALRQHRLTPSRLPIGSTGLVRLVLPLVLKRTLAGFLSVVGPAATFDELDELTLGPASVVCALELAKQRAVAEAEYRLQADVLEAALTGRFSSETEVMARARALGYELDGEQVALMFALDEDGDVAFAADSMRPRARLLDTLRRVLESQQRTALLRQQGDRVAVFLPRGANGALGVPEGADRLRCTVAEQIGVSGVSVGVGRPYAGVGGLATGYHEAEEALLIGQELAGGNCTIYFGDLGIRRLLFPLRDSPELRAFYDEFLGALEAYDERHGTELIRTLEGFFAHHGNHVRAADALHLHRNTLLYRLARIQTIAGLDLDDPEVRLAVQVCLRMRPLAGSRWHATRFGREDGPTVASGAHDASSAEVEFAISAPKALSGR